MRIKLETLAHQTAALKAINESFHGMDNSNSDRDANYIYANPLINLRNSDEANIDIKMETGTGKTYVYTRMMYELHKKYGLFKFVIAVPSPSIKEGTKNFIISDYARQHFSEFYDNTSIQLDIINAGDFSAKSGRRNFPAQLSEFVEGTRQNINQIQVLLVNAGMLHSKSMNRDDYDQTLLGGETCPIKAIAATRPIVIIDEPHRFSREKKYYTDIEAMKPQMIVRFGATFPEITIGKGKNKVTKSDYYRGKPQFNLNAIDSFNHGLVKGIDIIYPDISEGESTNLYKVKSAKPKELILTKNGKEYSVNQGEELIDIDEGFEGITYEGGTDRTLSNGLSLAHVKDMSMIPGTYSESYQDRIISEALDCHFETEKKNFLRTGADNNPPKIKTLSLFFIDSIASFRGENKEKGWLAKHFEKILIQKLQDRITELEMASSKREEEYREFLQATLKSLKSEHQNVYAGYFSEDRGSSDADIQAEVDDILKNKEKLLSFKDEHGNWLTRRFLFSKWTLREGWDNPNVFVIAKLRNSGSDISKIQEVGRGLRLPVDETGHRLTQEEWPSRLSFLVSYSERDFAQKLVGEINSDTPIELNKDKLTQEMIDLIVIERQKNDKKFNEEKLLENLDKYNVISRSNEFKKEVCFNGKNMSGFEAFLKLYPEVEQKIKANVDTVRDVQYDNSSTRIKLRKSNWNKLKNLWLKLSKRQMIVYDDAVNNEAEKIANGIIRENRFFVLQYPQRVQQQISVGERATFNESERAEYNCVTIPYGKFLKKLAEKTGVSVNVLNNSMCKKTKDDKFDIRFINEDTLKNLIKEFKEQFYRFLINHYHYEELDFGASTSIFDNQKQEFVDSVPASALGIYSYQSNKDDKYLYDRPPLRYDSENPELKLLKRSYGDEIKVFGKLPKSAIKIPRFDHGTTTPDFIFVIKPKSGKTVYLIVETKAENMRMGDQVIKSIQENYFNTLKETGVYYQLATSENEVRQRLQKLEKGEDQK